MPRGSHHVRTEDSTGSECLVDRLVLRAVRQSEAEPPLRGPELLRLHRAEPRHQIGWTTVSRARNALIVKSQLRNCDQRLVPIALVQISASSGVISPCGRRRASV